MKIFHRFKTTPDGGRQAKGQSEHGTYNITLSPQANGQECHIVNKAGQRVGGCMVNFTSPLDGSCTHRGDHIDDAPCKTCKGSVRIKVFACSVHGSCVIDRAVDGHTRCAGCGDRALSQA